MTRGHNQSVVWNGLGWSDPWSSKALSDRRATYAGRFESRCTPQMVVSGSDKFVGADRARARRSIAAALVSPVEIGVLPGPCGPLATGAPSVSRGESRRSACRKSVEDHTRIP